MTEDTWSFTNEQLDEPDPDVQMEDKLFTPFFFYTHTLLSFSSLEFSI